MKQIFWPLLAAAALCLAGLALVTTRYDVPENCPANGCLGFDRWKHRVVWVSAVGVTGFVTPDTLSRTERPPR